MAQNSINFKDDLPTIQKYILARVRAQAKIAQPISAMEFGLRLCQRGFLFINFDVREQHDGNMAWSRDWGGPPLKLTNWSKAYMQACRYGISFTLLNGTPRTLKAGAGDAAVAGEFGKTLLAVVRDSVARKVFDPLPLRKDCQLEILEFDWMWRWPLNPNDVGRTNILRRLRARRLPEPSLPQKH